MLFTKFDEHGKVQIFSIPANKVISVYPIDAREIIKNGAGRTIDDVTPVAEAEKKPEAPVAVDFDKCSDAVLLQFADMAGIPKTVKKRETIIDHLKKIKFDPAKASESKPD
jgi:hypothetical protein